MTTTEEFFEELYELPCPHQIEENFELDDGYGNSETEKMCRVSDTDFGDGDYDFCAMLSCPVVQAMMAYMPWKRAKEKYALNDNLSPT